MLEAFTGRGMQVTQLQRGAEVLSTLDPELGALVHRELTHHGVDVLTRTTVTSVDTTADGLAVHGTHRGEPITRTADVGQSMRTGLPHVFAAGDGVTTHHRLLGTTYLPLGTTSHTQGRVAGENALGGTARFAGSVGTQVVTVFDLVAARTGLRDHDDRRR